MNLADIIILAAVSCFVIFAVKSILFRWKNGCSCGCGGICGGCEGCGKNNTRCAECGKARR